VSSVKVIVVAGLLAAAAVVAVCAGRNRVSPSEMEAVCGLARLHLEQGEADKALAIYTDLLRRTGGAPYVRLGWAAALCEKGDLRAAEEQYRLLLASDPESPVVLFNLGQCLLKEGRRSEGEAFLKRFIDRYSVAFPELAKKARDAMAGAGAAGRPLKNG